MSSDGSKIICHCVQVSEKQIRDALQKGEQRLTCLKTDLHVASTCKFCFTDIVAIAKDEGIAEDEFLKGL